MESIGEYTIIERLDETRGSVVYRAQAPDGAGSVVVKVLKTRYPAPAEIARFRQEYDIIRGIESDGIVRALDIVERDDAIAIVLEDFSGISLRRILAEKRLPLRSALLVAAKAATALGDIHRQNIVHKDIKPHNILVNAATGAVKITDFGVAALLTRENEEIYNPLVVQGTLAYLSPEQTGRMNRTVDYRSDLYSLGITLYEMMIGRVPFPSADPMEVIHAHIARRPASPAELRPDVPRTVSDIVMKLLAKTAEERYQNGYGLAADLRECLARLKGTGRIAPFALGHKDISPRFIIPQSLHGREEEVASLLDAFGRVAGGAREVMLVTGDPGIGKSALVHEVHKPIVERRGYFISGKYDQFRRDVPYSALIQSFQGLVRQILTESEERIGRWRDRLGAALGANGRVITDIIPDVELIIAPQPELPALGPDESQNRFNAVFKSFVKAFATEEHPVALFLDDLQWSDAASLGLVATVFADPTLRHFFFIGAYRGGEAAESHLLSLAIETVRSSGVAISSVSLGPLGVDAINELIAHFLRSDIEHTRSLAALVERKTGGNPFFVNQFLKNLYDEGQLLLDPAAGWRWDTDRIEEMQVTENVVDLMSRKIVTLPEETQELLKICACVGNRFDLETLAHIAGVTIDRALADLTVALNEGLVSLHGDLYRFHHDRIQEAAQALIPEDDQARWHHAIGAYFLERTAPAELPEKIFYVVNQLNAALPRIVDPAERANLARLNIIAGSRAKSSTAYAEAAGCFRMALRLLPEDAWERDYDTMLHVHRELAASEHLNRNFEAAGALFDTALRRARSREDRAGLYNLKMIMVANLGRHEEAVDIGLTGLRLLGLRLPKRPGQLSLLMTVARLSCALRTHNAESLMSLPPMKDPRVLLMMSVLMNMSSSAYFFSKNLTILIALRMVQLTLRYGSSPLSAYAFVMYGGVLIAGFQRIDAGHMFGELALAISRAGGAPEQKAKILTIFGLLIEHWRRPLDRNIDVLRESLAVALQTGDHNYACYDMQTIVFTVIARGAPLREIEEENERFFDFIRQLRDPGALNYLISVRQFVKCLRGETRGPASLADDAFREDEHLFAMLKDNIPIILQRHYLLKLRLQYFAGDYASALAMARASERLLDYSIGQIVTVEHVAFAGLTAAALADASRGLARIRYRITLWRRRRLLARWAAGCPENFRHKHALLEAEAARLAGNSELALAAYRKAIREARENGFTQYEAIASERAARFFIGRRNEELARVYLAESIRAYEAWGATAKARALEVEFAAELERMSRAQRDFGFDGTSTGTSSGGSLRALDLQAVMKASQAISSQLELARILEVIMKISIENAGAERGLLILQKESDGRLYVEAEGSVEGGIVVLQSVPIDLEHATTDTSAAEGGASILPSGIINYVNKTHESVVLNNASTDGMFIGDPYVVSRNTRSVLCGPVVHQGKLSGILYLENNLTDGAFTPDRLELLRILSGQAAISIENARLLEHRENAAKLGRDMEIAANIQTALLPAAPAIPGYDLCAYLKPAEAVGGDYYDVICEGGRHWMVIGDVSGHGVHAGLIMMMAQTAIHVALNERPELTPAELLSTVNTTLTRNIQRLGEYKYMTASAFAVGADGTVDYAGLHQDILIYRARDGSVETIQTKGIFVGITEEIADKLEDERFTLEPGDTMLVFTDGITEMWRKGSVRGKRTPERDMFGIERLRNLFQSLAGSAAVEDIEAGILGSLDEYEPRDDITMMIVRRR